MSLSPAPTPPPPAPAPPAGARVVAVVVTYEPDPGALARLFAAIAPQVSAVVVVDNGSRDFARPPAPLPIHWLPLGSNLGLAAAQNRGLAAARDAGATHLLLLDQDSTPAPDMVAELLRAAGEAQAQGLRVGAVGPLVVDPQGHSEGFVRFRAGRYEALMPAPPQRWLDCDLLIASGTLMPVAALDAIGPMDEQLFIDKIDTEWSLRAAARGHVLLGVPSARLHHRLGEHAVKVWFLGWRRLRQHQPFRYYYMLRNGLLLRRLPHATPAWRRADGRQLLSLLLYFGVLAPGRGAALAMMLRGLVHGLRGVGGRLV